MKIVELLIDEEQELSGIEAISIVDEPAIEENFIALSKQHPLIFSFLYLLQQVLSRAV